MFEDVKSLLSVLTMINTGGMGVIVFVVWYFDFKKEKKRDEQHEQRVAMLEEQRKSRADEHKEEMHLHRESQVAILASMEKERLQTARQFDESLKEVRQYYLNNASLVRRYDEQVEAYKVMVDRVREDFRGIASDLKDAYIMNTQALSGLVETVRNNQFCPQVRENSGRGKKDLKIG